MKLHAYPEYKHTGIEWLGEVPEGWELKKVRHVAKVKIGITYSPDDIVDESEGVLVLRASNVQNGKLSFNDNVYVEKEIKDSDRVKEGDVLICSRNGSAHLVGKCAYITAEHTGYTFGAFMSVVRSGYGLYLYQFFNSDIFKAQSGLFSTSTINQLTSSTLENMVVAFPPKEEQTAIATYLDHATGRIDTLVAKKRRLIELLKEKRTALISRTVTCGLPAAVAREFGLEPHIRFKDSGIEWLGEVPEGWEVKKVRHLARFRGGSTPPTAEALYWDDGEIPWVSPKDMKSGRITDTQDHLTPEGAIQCASGIIQPGHVLIVVRSGILRHSLPVAINDVHVTLNQDMRVFILNDRLVGEFLRWFIEGKEKALLENWCKPGTTVESIEMSYVSSSSLPVPPQTEQTAIAAYLDRVTAKIDKLMEKVETAIARLQEYRTALITAAVTGKIDVRGKETANV